MIEKLFSSGYASVPTSPSIGGGSSRRSLASRMLKPALILVALITTISIIIAASSHHEYIAQHLTQHPFSLSSDPADSSLTTSPAVNLPPKTVAAIQNSTLGFERVLMINLPIRTDKLDMFALAASQTGFNFSVIEGVENGKIPAVALPWDWGDEEPPVRGVWRAHLNAILTVVREGLSSALIIEDDADWDVNIKSQLPPIAMGTQHLLNTSQKHNEPHSPYGDGWDMLWLGHCASEAKEDTERFLINNDPTVPPPSKQWNMWTPGYNAQGVTNSTRVVSRNNNAICTQGYAVSYAGAQKILYHVSTQPNPDAIDTAYNHLCDSALKGDNPEFECLNVWPAIINSFLKQGSEAGDSDQSDPGRTKEPTEKAQIRTKSYAYNLMWSAKMNMGNLVMGKNPEQQWRDEDMQDREFEEGRNVATAVQASGWSRRDDGQKHDGLQ